MENDLAAAQKVAAEGVEALKLAEGKKEAIDTKADKIRKEGKVPEAKLKKVEQENVELKKEMEELWTRLVAWRKEIGELQTGFAAQKKQLETEYQKEVDEMYFFGYCCCMKKNDITQDFFGFLLTMRMKYPEVSLDEMTFLPCLVLSEHTFFLLLDSFLSAVIDPANDL